MIMELDNYYPNIDRLFRLPRVWSNRELRKFSHLFKGDIVNVSGWKDIDKEGDKYVNYFKNANSYTITNFKTEAKGIQGYKNELYLDLEDDLSENLRRSFDVVFNHTVLEHIYDVKKAFENICELTKDIVIIVVPFLQVMHADYGDYWRFTPMSIERMFKDNDMDLLYCSFNSHKNSSVYLFCIGTRNKKKWKKLIPEKKSFEDPYPSQNGFQNWVGCHAIQNGKYMRKNRNKLYQIKLSVKKILKKLN